MTMTLLSARAKMICQIEQISDDEIQQMCKLAAMAHEGAFNRRYHGWFLDIRDGVCHNMRMVADRAIGVDRDGTYAEEEHEDCGGRGCHSCGWTGSIRRYI